MKSSLNISIERNKTPVNMYSTFYKKEFIPGYAAHVPKMQHLFGVSSGKMKGILIKKDGVKTFLHGEKSPYNLNVSKDKTPGYSGHMRGLHAENIHGRSFGVIEKKSNNIQIKRSKPSKSPISLNMASFKLSRHSKNMNGRNLTHYMDKDYTDYAKFVNSRMA